MSYGNYVIAAYCVFAVVLLWDFVAPRLQIRQLRRAAALRTARVRGARVEVPLARDALSPESRDTGE